MITFWSFCHYRVLVPGNSLSKGYTVGEFIVEGRNNNHTDMCAHNWDKFKIVKKCVWKP